jgi:AraC family transcriptional regulator, regulatory protein of adaptative response / methylated-DNA-[protein]-cysteine methyltransferase
LRRSWAALRAPLVVLTGTGGTLGGQTLAGFGRGDPVFENSYACDRSNYANMTSGLATVLDRDRCNQARLRRDAAYDGAFFTCVRTTKIYCRPVCPSAHARSHNVFFVPSAAAAERLGFRPCLRCRPESAPGSAAWRGTATTVARGMRLIQAGFLDTHSVGDLASKLGIGSRHLARLFMTHVAATPTGVAFTRRVQIAKRLISDTALPLNRIAFEAGFNSVRRFNDAFQKTYKRPPSSFRRG